MKRILLLAGLLLALSAPVAWAQTAVFINEIHYDNSGSDAGEAVEVAGPSGTDLSGWSIVLYNGSATQLNEYGTIALSGFIPDLGGGFGTVFVDTPGIQNGAPDGLVLFDGTSVVQFLSYEGSFTAASGVASGLTSTDIGVSESGTTQAGESLQLGGTGANYEDFTWETAAASTFGAVNTNQVFDGDGGGTPPPPVVINEIDADQTSTDNAEFVELYDGGIGNTDLTTLSLVFFNGSNDEAYEAFDLDGLSTNADGYFVLCGDALNVANCDLEVSPATNLIQNGADAIALYQADASAFPDGAAVTTDNLVDAIVYDTNDADDAELLVLLNTGEAQVNEDEAGDKDNHSSQRIPNGAGGNRNTSTYAQLPPTPGAENNAPAPDVSIVINEVDADQTSTDTAEFVELYDGGTGSSDLSGLVLVFFNGSSDTAYEAFDLDGQSTNAEGYFVLCGDAANVPNCDLDVSPDDNLIQNGADAIALYVGDAGSFADGTPVSLVDLVDAIVYDTNDGDDAGLLVLLNADEPQVNEDGAGDKDNQSSQRIPNGEGGQRNTTAYQQLTPTPGTENGVPVSGGIAEIFEIQGSGLTSPFADAIVTTENNVVTTLRPDGFFIQTPADRTDGDPATSDGIFVFTDAAPTVAVGDLVTVTGKVVEFFEFTEFSEGPVVEVLGTGTVPAPVVFDETLPSPDQPQDETAYERYEGMLISIADGYVVGPNQSFGSDPEAEAFIVASGAQVYREPGILFPGIDGLPVWDGNPEVFEIDPDKLGLPNQLLAIGSTFEATGVLGFEFGDYELWPSSLTVSSSTLPEPVRAPDASEATVASLNLFRLFDDVADGTEEVIDAAEYAVRLAKFSLYIRDVLQSPDIIAVQEVEKLGVLQDLAAQIEADDPALIYDAYLIEGNDVGGIDVGFLVNASAVQVNAVTQLAADELLTFDGSLLHDRPPLLLEADFLAYGVPVAPIEVLGVHNRSLSGIETSDRVRIKRLEQAQSIAQIVQTRQTANPDVRLMVVGDFNAFEFSDGYVDAIGQISGTFNPDDNLLSGDDLVDPDLTNQVLSLPAEERYSFNFGGSAQVLDHALTTTGLDSYITGFAYGRGNSGAPRVLIDDASTPLRASDHDGFVVYVEVQEPFAATAVLAAEDGIHIEERSQILSGDLLVRSAANADAYSLILEPKTTTATGYELKADNMLFLRKTQVAGDVFYNSITNQGTITGSETSSLVLPVFNFPPFPSISAGGDDVVVTDYNTHALPPGSYGHVLVRPNATLMLEAGLYEVESLSVMNNAAVQYNGSGEMRINSYFTTGGDCVIGPESGSGLSAADYVFFVGGSGVTGYAADLGRLSTYEANVYVAAGGLRMGDNVEATGAFLAESISIGRNARLSLDSYWMETPLQPVVTAKSKGSDQFELEGDGDTDTEIALPTEYALSQNYPNPFNPTTAIPFSLPETGHVKLVVYDILGRVVETIVDGVVDAGHHAAAFNAAAYPSGAYLYRIEANGFTATYKMMLIK